MTRPAGSCPYYPAVRFGGRTLGSVMAATSTEASLVPHDHDWFLVAVDYEDALEVQEFQCVGCGATVYR